MPDVIDPATRSRMMAGIRGVDTGPELLVRSELHRAGFRFRLHVKSLPGKPDIVLPRYGAVVVVHGCFWHRHECHYFKWPRSNSSFWKEKLEGNAQRDARHVAELRKLGWRVAVIWECAVRDSGDGTAVAKRLAQWLRSSRPGLTIG